MVAHVLTVFVHVQHNMLDQLVNIVKKNLNERKQNLQILSL